MWRNRIQKNGTYRFPLIVEALACLRSRSCIVDGEAVAQFLNCSWNTFALPFWV
jgi:ATP-dependent DNA ligase